MEEVCAVRNCCSKGNIDCSKNVLAETDMIYTISVFSIITQVIIEICALPLAEVFIAGRTNLLNVVFSSFLQQLLILTNNDIFLYTAQMLPCWILWLNNQMPNSPSFFLNCSNTNLHKQGIVLICIHVPLLHT